MAAWLSTTDNPWDYFDQWEDWYEFDTNQKKYGTCAYIGRIARTSEQLSEAENQAEIERAVDEVLKYNQGPIGYNEKGEPIYYVKVFSSDDKRRKTLKRHAALS